MIWEKRYVFVKSMLPSFINEEFGRRVSLHGLLSPACRRAIVGSDSLSYPDIHHWQEHQFYPL